jgi:3-hydroxyacyl-[acyl-carrier-protein] dehydratase
MGRPTEEVLALVPHRSPFLFLDEILARDDRHIKAVMTLQPDEPSLAGHYPGWPIMPGVLLCECVFQAGAALLADRRGLDLQPSGPDGRVPLLARIRDARFRRPVYPGARLVIEVDIAEEVGSAAILKGSISVDGLPVMSTEFVVVMSDVGESPATEGLT